MKLTRRHALSGLGASVLVGCASKTDSPSPQPATPTSEPDTTPGPGSTGDTGYVTLSQPLGANPAADGFFFPAEWEPHAGCLMQLPPPSNYCPPGQADCAFIREAQAEWVAVANAIAQFEKVRLYATPEDAAQVRPYLDGAIELLEAELSDGWSRDSGPLFLRNDAGDVRAACFAFNGWGESVPHFSEDAAIKWRMASDAAVETYDHPMVLEGGAVLLDGAGTLITTEQCLLHPSRNPDLDQAAQEQILKDYFGVHTVIWLGNGWNPDPLTNGHVDGICHIVKPGLALLNSMPPGLTSPNALMLADARQRLEAAGWEVVGLPATSASAFHINLYTANGAVIVPIEEGPADNTPLGILRDLYPNHQVVGVRATTLGRAGGGIHCITQQIPEGVTLD